MGYWEVVNYAEKPFGTEGNDMEMDKVNPLVADTLFSAAMKISVDLGTTSKTVKEVFAMNKGTIFELDEFAGDFVDIKDNGVLFALGEVVCIDDKFGVRITEIIGAPDAYGQCEPQQPAPEQSEPLKPITTEEEYREVVDGLIKSTEGFFKEPTTEEST